MKELYWQSWAAILGFLVGLLFIWFPSPYTISAFTFLAQPLFVVAFLGYALKVYQELRRRKIL